MTRRRKRVRPAPKLGVLPGEVDIRHPALFGEPEPDTTLVWSFEVISIPATRKNQGKPCEFCGQKVYGPRSKVVPIGNHPFPRTGRDRQGFGWYVCLEGSSSCSILIQAAKIQEVSQ